MVNENSEILIRQARLEKILRGLKRVAVAFSGGLDSTYLLAVAQRVLGENAVAYTAVSSVFPPAETERAHRLAKALNISHITFEVNHLAISGFAENSRDRCYICKKNLMAVFRQRMHADGIPYLLHGENVDDQNDDRPGSLAAAEAGALAPLVRAGLGKDAIRRLSREMNLETWNLPSMACLASRVPYRMAITEKILRQIAQAESILQDLGFSVCRVRHHGDVARIEVATSEIERLVRTEKRALIATALAKIGFRYIAVDLQGYQTGSMNRQTTDRPL
jgi:uncharacterized protein